MQPAAVLFGLLLGLTSLGGRSAAKAGEDELLIGWQGETYQLKEGEGQHVQARRKWIETIAWKPRAFVYHNFMSPQECDHMVALGNERVARSTVVDSKTGNSVLDPVRTSFGAFFGRGEDAVIASIEQRIAEWTHLPPEHGEHIQILRYVDGQKYDAHWDWFDNKHYFGSEGNRVATVLLYLAEVEEGGETYLPLAEPIDEEVQAPRNVSSCVTSHQSIGLAVLPVKGDALLFWDMSPMASTGDRHALHASCPTLKGTKWTATKWIHEKMFMGSFNSLALASRCVDTQKDCAALVKGNLCYKNMTTMVGATGVCRKSCGDCINCPQDDLLCQRRNVRGMFDVSNMKGVPSS